MRYRSIALAVALLWSGTAQAQTYVSNVPNAVMSIADVVQYAIPTSGSTVSINVGNSLLFLNNSSLLATLTVTLPSNPVDGQRVIITSAAGITLLTVNGGTINGLVTGLSANGYARYAYSASASAWFRTG